MPTTEEKLQNAIQQQDCVPVNLLQTYLANFSQEIRTPLTAIYGMLELFQKTELSEEQQKLLRIINISSENILATLDDYLKITKLRENIAQKSTRNFNIKQLKEELQLYVNSFSYNKLEFIPEIDRNLPEIEVSGEYQKINFLIVQVFSSLKQSYINGVIGVKMYFVEEIHSDVFLKYEFRINAQVYNNQQALFLTSLFQPNTKTPEQNVELIAKRYLDFLDNNYWINIQSEKELTISFQIALKKEANESQPSNLQSLGAGGNFKGAKILVVEDQEFNQIVVQSYLTEWECDITLVTNGEKAVNYLKQNSSDLILMDIQMPVMDGVEATKIIRSQFPQPICNIPIIALTANAVDAEIESFLACGMNDYICKPFKSKELFKKIKKYLGQSSIPPVFHTEEPVIPPENKLYDISGIEKMSRGDGTFVKKMLSIFVQQTNNTLLQIEELIPQKDWRSVSAYIHKIRPSFKVMGILHLEDNLNKLENMGKVEVNEEEFLILFVNIKNSINHLIKEMETEINQ